MGFILTSSEGEDLCINAWNWRPTAELLRAAGLVAEETYALMGWQSGVEVDAGTARRIAEFLEIRIDGMRPGSRMRFDLSITSEPREPLVFTPTSWTGDADLNEVYSATYEWLVEFKGFCQRSGGFSVG